MARGAAGVGVAGHRPRGTAVLYDMPSEFDDVFGNSAGGQAKAASQAPVAHMVFADARQPVPSRAPRRRRLHGTGEEHLRSGLRRQRAGGSTWL